MTPRSRDRAQPLVQLTQVRRPYQAQIRFDANGPGLGLKVEIASVA